MTAKDTRARIAERINTRHYGSTVQPEDIIGITVEFDDGYTSDPDYECRPATFSMRAVLRPGASVSGETRTTATEYLLDDYTTSTVLSAALTAFITS